MIDSQWASQEHIHPTERAREALLNESAKEKLISVYGLGEAGWGDSKEIKLFTPGGYFNDTYLFAPEVEQVERNAFFIDGNGNKVYTIDPALEHYPSRYGTADGTMPIDSPSAGAMAGQAYDSAVLETTDLFEAVDQRGVGLLGDILDNALNSTNAWAKDVVERGPKAFIPDQVYHGSASEKALVDQLLGNEPAQLEHATDNAVFYSEMAGTVITGGAGLGWKTGREVAGEVVDTATETVLRNADVPLQVDNQFDEFALEGQARQQTLLESNRGYNVTGAESEINYPNGTIGNPHPSNPDNLPGIPENDTTFLTDRQGFEDVLGALPENGGTIRVTKDQLRSLEEGLGLEPRSLDSGSVIRQLDNVDQLNPASPLDGNDFFRGPGQHLPSGAPEIIINPAQPRIDNPNIANEWKIEVVD